jgi:short-subunit dehydrogenase
MPTVLITGASGGLGAELARLFAADGHDLILAARSTDKLAALAEELAGRHPIRARPVTVDLSAAAGPGVLAQALARDGSEVGVLVNNAGVGLHGPFAATSLDRELAMLQLNVTSLVHLTKLLLPGMRARGHGQIVNVASTAAFQPGPLMSVYYASKAFVLSFSEALAEELAGSGVAVTAVCFGPVRTGFQPAAGMRGERLLQSFALMDAPRAARIAYRGIRRRRRVVVAGALNRLHLLGIGVLPRRLVTRVVRLLNESLG